jgi:hypothetical protein
VLDVACQKCPRRGPYRVTRLIDRNGAGMSCRALKNLISPDCPKHTSHSIYDQSGVHFPGWRNWRFSAWSLSRSQNSRGEKYSIAA